MSPLSLTVRDSTTMLRRNLLHARRYPSLTLNVLLTPVVLLLLFVYVFGDTMSAGITGSVDRDVYVTYLLPGILVMTIGGTALGTAVSVAGDMSQGIIDRFRTMAISRASILVGHVVGAVLKTLMSLAFVLALGLTIGFRPEADTFDWIAAVGVLTLASLALTWIAVALGMASPTPEGASNNGLPLMLLPFLSSAFVPLDAMPGWFRPIAEYQPFTPVIETLRGLLLGDPIGARNAVLALAWCVVLSVLGYLWSKTLFNREPRR
ncbi:ABC transporter permease [Streptodolium elevatio]